MQQLLRKTAIDLVADAVVNGEIDADVAEGGKAAQHDAFFNEDHLCAAARCRHRGRHAGDAAADDDHIGLTCDGDLSRAFRYIVHHTLFPFL